MEDTCVKVSEVEDEPRHNRCSTSSGRSSPDSNCPICLGKLDNKSFTDSCFHQFCFACLQEWSNVKAECPLCKQTFKAIIYNIRSMQEYDQYELPPRDDTTDFELPVNWREAFIPPPSFNYSTSSQVSTYIDYVVRLERCLNNQVLPALPEATRSAHLHSRNVSTESFRRNIYREGLWVRQMPVWGLNRVCSPRFYRDNPPSTHRLVPWLTRELNVLCDSSGSEAPTLLPRIMELITQLPIRSIDFSTAVGSYIGRHVAHFVHEFYNFATSPYDMIGWDRHASYSSGSFTHLRTTDSDDSDVQVLETTDESSPPIQPGSDNDCVVVDDQHSPEVITIDSEEEEVQVDVNINPEAGPSHQPPSKQQHRRHIKSGPKQNMNVSININQAGPSRSRPRRVSSSSSEDCSPPHRVKRNRRMLNPRKSNNLLEGSEEEGDVQPQQPPAPPKKRARKLSSGNDDSNVLRIDTDPSLSTETSSEEERCRNTGQAQDAQVSAETQAPKQQRHSTSESSESTDSISDSSSYTDSSESSESSDSSNSDYSGPSRGARCNSSTNCKTK